MTPDLCPVPNSYSIPDSAMAEQFIVDPNTGALRLGAQLDRETTPTFQVGVACTDGRYSASPVAMVTVTVGDVNDSPPQFTDERVDIRVS